MSELVLLSPLPGWVAPLEEVPDPVFSGKLVGDGLAIDPTGSTLVAPCDGELTVLPDTAHAVTIRASNGAEILLHVGIDTVALKGAGFTALARAGQAVRAGEPLLRLDLDRLARTAVSLVTPVLVIEPERFRIVDRHAPGQVGAGERLMVLRSADSARATGTAGSNDAPVTGTLIVPLPHGLHARPAALIAQALKELRTDTRLTLRGRSANARSPVALMALGARHGDRLALHATGIDAPVVQGAIEQAFARALARHDADPPVPAPRIATGAVTGVVASGGIAIGESVRIVRTEPTVVERGRGAWFELQQLDEARARMRQRLLRLAAGQGDARTSVVGAHLEFLDDPELLSSTHTGIAGGSSAAFAWRTAIREAVGALESIEDAHLRARVDDLRDLEVQLVELLSGVGEPPGRELPEHAILVARELLPSQFLSLAGSHIAGICTVSCAATSHVAILAGAMGVPMLTGVDPTLLSIADGTRLLVDADGGRVTVEPDEREIAEAQGRIAERAKLRARLRTAAAFDCRTADGERVEVFANVGSLAEAAAAVGAGAEGCGLLRTEFLFLDRLEAPDVQEQAIQYQKVVEAFGGRPVVVRTLDAGSDKALPFLAMPPQDNPALGLRGIRASLSRPELLRAQIAAILAVRPEGRCRILLPMVNEAAEIEAVRRMIDELAAGTRVNPRISLGIMIETPASALNAARLARHADFFSIGTNDLTQYVLAVDRTHPLLAGELDALHPAVLRLVGEACSAGRAAARGVAVCGGLASDPAAAPLLVGLGATELSAIPAAIPAVKEAIRGQTLAACRELARRALDLDTSVAVRSLLSEYAAGKSQ